MIDESCGAEAAKQQAEGMKRGIRTQVMSSLNLNCLAWMPKGPIDRANDLGMLCRWEMRWLAEGRRWGTRGRISMDVKKLSDDWIEAIAGMCLAHDKDTYDANDARADKLLTPILSAPAKQIREFYGVMLEKMKADPRVPFLVWISFEAWGEVMVKNAPDEGVKRLKNKLAGDIADLVEGPVAEQIPEAIKRALKWRDPETLTEIKTALEGGAKPKLVGRQSCLFLECKPKGRGTKKISVMV